MTLGQRLSVSILSFSLMAASCTAEIEIEFPNVCFDEKLSVNPLDTNVPFRDLDAAAEMWNDAVGATVIRVTPFFEGNVVITEVPVMPEEYRDKAGVAYSNWDPIDGSFVDCTILLNRGDWYDKILAHELGHCFGLGHDDDEEHPSSLMRSTVRYDSMILPHHVEHVKQCPLTRAEIQP